MQHGDFGAPSDGSTDRVRGHEGCRRVPVWVQAAEQTLTSPDPAVPRWLSSDGGHGSDFRLSESNFNEVLEDPNRLRRVDGQLHRQRSILV